MNTPAAFASSIRRGSPGEEAFDAWLREGLQRTYAGCAREPLPDCLLRLCETAAGEPRDRG